MRKWMFGIVLLLAGCGQKEAQLAFLRTIINEAQIKPLMSEWELGNSLASMKKQELETLQVSYNVKEAPTIERARFLLKETVRGLKERSGLELDSIQVSLAFRTPEGAMVAGEEVSHVYLFNGTVYYSFITPGRYGLEVRAQEPLSAVMVSP